MEEIAELAKSLKSRRNANGGVIKTHKQRSDVGCKHKPKNGAVVASDDEQDEDEDEDGGDHDDNDEDNDIPSTLQLLAHLIRPYRAIYGCCLALGPLLGLHGITSDSENRCRQRVPAPPLPPCPGPAAAGPEQVLPHDPRPTALIAAPVAAGSAHLPHRSRPTAPAPLLARHPGPATMGPKRVLPHDPHPTALIAAPVAAGSAHLPHRSRPTTPALPLMRRPGPAAMGPERVLPYDPHPTTLIAAPVAASSAHLPRHSRPALGRPPRGLSGHRRQRAPALPLPPRSTLRRLLAYQTQRRLRTHAPARPVTPTHRHGIHARTTLAQPRSTRTTLGGHMSAPPAAPCLLRYRVQWRLQRRPPIPAPNLWPPLYLARPARQ
ncbi:hypothetical protein C8J57DRAFT_1533816 [Mycena rebaudengoi]|nr:hypothetical protein C8J57DRAFT_1533816 [Mycena rebaudengoi]